MMHNLVWFYLLKTTSLKPHFMITSFPRWEFPFIISPHYWTDFRMHTLGSVVAFHTVIDSSWNVMAHGDAREGK